MKYLLLLIPSRERIRRLGRCIGIGRLALEDNTSGQNIGIGYQAGTNLTASGGQLSASAGGVSEADATALILALG